MKLFLFMYPLGQFFEEIPIDLSISFEPTRGVLTRDDLWGVNNIIEARYRSQGYDIAWVFYGQRGKKHLPDCSDAAKYVSIHPGDAVISSGSYTGEPSFEFIFSQLPADIEQLVVGGFHWLSCVAFTVDYAIEALGYRAHIDEDTTQQYFSKTAILRNYQNRDLELLGEPCHPGYMAGLKDQQVHLFRGMHYKPWIVRETPGQEVVFLFDGKLESFPREEVEKELLP